MRLPSIQQVGCVWKAKCGWLCWGGSICLTWRSSRYIVWKSQYMHRRLDSVGNPQGRTIMRLGWAWLELRSWMWRSVSELQINKKGRLQVLLAVHLIVSPNSALPVLWSFESTHTFPRLGTGCEVPIRKQRATHKYPSLTAHLHLLVRLLVDHLGRYWLGQISYSGIKFGSFLVWPRPNWAGSPLLLEWDSMWIQIT